METLTQPPADVELHLLTEWGDEAGESRRRKAAVATIALHVAIVGLLAILPSGFFGPPKPPVETAEVRRITPIFLPLTELTQKAPNKNKLSKEFEVAGSVPQPRVQVPKTPPPSPRPAPPRAVIPAMPQPKPAAEQAMPEPPKIEAAAKPLPKIDLPPSITAPPPPPSRPTVEKPKLTFENLGAPPPPVPASERKVPLPDTSIREAIRDTMHPGSSGTVVGDAGALGPRGLGGVNLPPTAGKQQAAMELKSDAEGVDFKPYLTQILAIIRRNWMAVIPDSGRRGKVVMQLSIGRDGKIDKLVYASQSGTDALDKAAVAGISASNPLPPLPADFKGGRIVVQLNFVYNMLSQ